MNEQLQNALALILQKAVVGIEEGISFLSAELPDVVHQLLLWHMVHSVILTIIGVVVAVSAVWVMIKYSGIGEKYEVETYYTKITKHKFTLTHNDSGEVDGHVLLTLPILAITGFCGVMTTNLTWLKILIAPKLYLIEYAATLVK